MYRILGLKARAWHTFITEKKEWLKKTPALWVLPRGEDAIYLQEADPHLSSKEITTIPQLIQGYRAKWLGPHLRPGRESLMRP